MLWTIIVILIMLWLLGLATGDTMGYFIHVPLFIALIAMLIKIEADCNNYGSGLTRKRYLKRQLVSEARNILPKFAMLSKEKISQAIISRQTYKKE